MSIAKNVVPEIGICVQITTNKLSFRSLVILLVSLNKCRSARSVNLSLTYLHPHL